MSDENDGAMICRSQLNVTPLFVIFEGLLAVFRYNNYRFLTQDTWKEIIVYLSNLRDVNAVEVSVSN